MPTVRESYAGGVAAGGTRAFRLGVGGPVGSGKTALVAALCRSLTANCVLA